MPTKPKHPCAYPLCPNLVEAGQKYCSKHKGSIAPQDTRPPASERGYDWQWHKLRTMYLKHNPLCERCRAKGRVTPADTVHHIKPVAQYPELRLNWDNLMSLCRECHEIVEGRKKEKESKQG